MIPGKGIQGKEVNANRAKAKNHHVVILTKAVLEARDRQKAKEAAYVAKGGKKRFIDPSKLQWKPPTFTASSRTWNW